MERINYLKNRLNGGIDFLKSVEELFNCHMVNFITENLWEKHIPPLIKEELTKTEEKDILEIIYLLGNSKSMNDLNNLKSELTLTCPSLLKFLIRCRQFSFEMVDPSVNVHFQKNGFYDESSKPELATIKGTPSKCNLSSQYLTPAKKRHEVEIMSSFIAKICKIHLEKRGITGAIVDIGGGKGYLGSALAFQHGLKVLGIDVASNVTSAAKNRNEKICHKLSEKYSLYQHKTVFVTSNTDLGNLVKEFEPEWGVVTRVALVGLHTCGNLSSSSIKLFTTMQVSDVPVTILCNVGCCYNLLKEKYIPEGSFDKAQQCLPPSLHGHSVDLPVDASPGFPLSDFLCKKKFWLGRNARNLASQSLERVMSQRHIAVDALFQRAVLQTVLLDYGKHCSKSIEHLLSSKLDEMLVEGKGVGRITKKNCGISMQEYLKRAFGKLKLEFEMSDDAVLEMCQRFEHFKSKITIFYLIRLFLAPVIESIILLDRQLYLLEEGINEAYIVKLFDPVISPRCYALFALK